MEFYNYFNNEIEQEYSRKTDVKYRRSQGQFFTPLPIAKFMSEWLLENEKSELEILDPASGFGIFERSIVELTKNSSRKIQFDLWEKDKNIGESLKKIINELNIRANIKESDFLNSSWEKLYDGIIANPPYYKHHHIENKQKIFEDICLNSFFKFSIQTNIYCWFLIKCLSLLKKNGRMAFIVPSEFINSNYGVKVKSFLISCGKIRHLISVNFSENIFDNALTTSLIIFAENSATKLDRINFFKVEDVGELKNLPSFLIKHKHKSFQLTELNPETKWRNYYNGEKIIDDRKFVSFKQVGSFSRGIATGSNEYFTLSKSEAGKFSIPENCLIPCITKANLVKGITFNNKDFEELVNLGKKVFLFNGEVSVEESVKDYIKKGEEEGIHERFLTKIRKPWYALEKRDKSYIWCSVFGRKGLKFIWNETSCINLTCFHVFYPTSFGRNFLNIIFIYLNTNFAMKMFEFEKREYGNGLEKFEPNDINKSLIIDFNLLSEKQIEELSLLQKDLLKAGIKEKEIIDKADAILEEVLRLS